MAKLVEILDGAGINSERIDCWINESCCFICWYLDMNNELSLKEFAIKYENANHLELEAACLKIETKMDVPFYDNVKLNK